MKKEAQRGKTRAQAAAWMSRWSPPGLDWRIELYWLGGGLVLSLFYGLTFFGAYFNVRNELFQSVHGRMQLIGGAVMPGFFIVADGCLRGFFALAAVMAALSGLRYLYYFQGSKSIYLMRRLPKRNELWLRCAVLPAAAALLSLCAAGIFLLVCFAVYMNATPEACLAGELYERLWGAGSLQ